VVGLAWGLEGPVTGLLSKLGDASRWNLEWLHGGEGQIWWCEHGAVRDTVSTFRDTQRLERALRLQPHALCHAMNRVPTGGASSGTLAVLQIQGTIQAHTRDFCRTLAHRGPSKSNKDGQKVTL
jgi:hypothetical protein